MKKLDQLKETYKKLGEEIKDLETPKIDFSKWIGRSGTLLCIRGENQLVAFSDGDILYANNNRYCSDDKINYKHTILDKLKEGDVFIFELDIVNIKKSDFLIFKGLDNDGDYVNNYLITINGIELIDCFYINSRNKKDKIIKFLRN